MIELSLKHLGYFLSKIGGCQENSQCWSWMGAISSNGYGKFSCYVRGSFYCASAHRLAYQYLVGDIPFGMYVLHKCDNPGCVNPEHLFIGTPLDNMRDKVAKGRQQRGSTHPNSKLTEEQVVDIRTRVACGENRKEIAKSYAIAKSTVDCISCRVSWKHVA